MSPGSESEPFLNDRDSTFEAPKEHADDARDALLEAVENTDISFFSPLFDREYDRLVSRPHPGKTQEQLWEESFGAIANNEIIKRVGLERILLAYQNGHKATKHFSSLTRRALDYFISNHHLLDESPEEKRE